LVKNQVLKSQSIGFELQKHSFWDAKHHLLEDKTYVFATRKTWF